MQLENEFSVPAPVSEVWKTLLDVERIAPRMPGAAVERVDGDEVAGRVPRHGRAGHGELRRPGRFVTKDEAAHRFVLEGNGRETWGLDGADHVRHLVRVGGDQVHAGLHHLRSAA
jgi:carbon monoxide dehydrogenase subunit G